MERVRAVFFDAGGTLIFFDRRFLLDVVRAQGVDVADHAFIDADRAATAHAAERMRSGHASDDLARWRAYGERLLQELGCGESAAEAVGEALRERHLAGTLWTHVEPGTAALLELLRERGYSLYIVSNADGRMADFLRLAGLLEHFDEVFDSAIVGAEKPDPAIFRHACERAGIEPEEAIHVGDILEFDVLGARAAGVHPVLFDPYATFGDVDCTRIAALGELTGLLPGAPSHACAADSRRGRG